MRLICPNCGAQYEVDDDVIPAAGRDVQCSNCGHTWFQRAASPGPETVEDDAAQDAAPPPVSEVEAPPPGPAPDALSDEEFEDEADGPLERELTRRKLDSSVTDILREEAERETAERANDPVGLETQTELGLDSGSDDRGEDQPRPDEEASEEADEETTPEEAEETEETASQDAATVPADVDHEAEEMTVTSVTPAAARRDLLPDIEEINSTLAPASDRDEDDAEERADQEARSGFRRGFIIAVLFFAVLALLYAYAPRIADAVPALEPILTTYVAAVNELRLWIDGMMQSAVEKLTTLLGQVSGSEA